MIAPQRLESSFLNWDAIDFAANTENATWYNYYVKGISGGFNGYYYILPVHQKIREYSGSESRDIRFFPLKLSEKEYNKLMTNLSELRGKSHPYKFFTYNCAHGLYFLLYNSLDSLPPPTANIMAPVEVILILQKENRLEYPYLLPSLKERILNADDKEQAELEFMEWKNLKKGAKQNIKRERKE